MQKKSINEQKQSKYTLQYSPLDWSTDFPIFVSGINVQHDREITFLHQHNALELGLCLEGTGIFVVEDKVIPFRGGDVCVIPPGERHLAQSSKGTVSRWIWLYMDAPRLLYPAFNNPAMLDFAAFSGKQFANIISRDANPEYYSIINEIINTVRNKNTFYMEKTISLLCILIAALHRDKTNDAHDEAHGNSNALARIQKALQHITRHYREPHNVKKLAQLCALSVPHFRRLFKQAMEKSPMEYMNHVRIMIASAELLQGSKTISMIALDSGFNSISSFNRQFQKNRGLSPREWRGRKQ
jgi:AraC-like DNA-binding protein